ncbi:NUDIX hydrolase [Alkalihalobacterium elongatum]|uniref:NUDIX hydrolase n=1 Tax=Alkalihalobacterium elongatum TaxID=2675466 RepID=UPI001C1F243E|nr:NUDIX domain-containing protein [Alkalihalobacterium elongatum]
MESEQITIFNEEKKTIGVASREEVHKKGYWHEVFHCWIVSKEKGKDYIYLQLRSKDKKDYPNLLDITAAGHILADESIEDGVREIKEELGIDVMFEELISLGIIDYCVTKENFIDKELANVFLHISDKGFDEFTLQLEEVSGIFKAELKDFIGLWFGEKETIEVNGFHVNEDGNKFTLDQQVGIDQFVPHSIEFYQTVIYKIKEKLGY